MKKILKWLLPIILISLLGIYQFNQHPILLRYFTGSARIVGRSLPSSVMINGEYQYSAKVFHQMDNFEGSSKQDYIILYLPRIDNPNLSFVILIDQIKQQVLLPNYNKKDYDMILGYLFQSESGAKVAKPFSFFGHDPQLKIVDNKLSFKLNKWCFHGYQIETVSIEIKE